MIRIVYWPDENRVAIEGHAESAKEGEDLICAAVSALAHTLRCNLERLDGLELLRAAEVIMEKGAARLSAVPKVRYRSTVHMIFQSVCVGFDFLADEYPDFVKYEVRG